MIISITDFAMNKLQERIVIEEYSPRIDAEIAGGCGLSVKFTLSFDEPRRNDTVTEYKGVKFLIDHFTKRYLDEEVHINFSNEYGFLIAERFASSACAL